MVLVKSRLMSVVSSGESLIIISWDEEPLVWMMEVIKVRLVVGGRALIDVRNRRTGVGCLGTEACWCSWLMA